MRSSFQKHSSDFGKHYLGEKLQRQVIAAKEGMQKIGKQLAGRGKNILSADKKTKRKFLVFLAVERKYLSAFQRYLLERNAPARDIESLEMHKFANTSLSRRITRTLKKKE